MILMTFYIVEKDQAFLHFHKNHLVLVCGAVQMFEDFIMSKGKIKAIIRNTAA